MAALNRPSRVPFRAHELGGGVDVEAVAAREPAGDGGAELRACRRSAGRARTRPACSATMRPTISGSGCFGSPMVMASSGPPGRHAVEQPPQPRKGIFRQVCEPRGKLHRRASLPGSRSSPRSDCTLALQPPRGPAFCGASGRGRARSGGADRGASRGVAPRPAAIAIRPQHGMPVGSVRAQRPSRLAIAGVAQRQQVLGGEVARGRRAAARRWAAGSAWSAAAPRRSRRSRRRPGGAHARRAAARPRR